MANDREGKLHPRKGKPSGSLNSDTPGLKPINTGSYDEHLEIADKYTVGDEQPAPHVWLRHPNRNPDKREERQQARSEGKSGSAKRDPLKDVNAPMVNPSQAIGLDFLSKEDFAELANFSSDCCISFFLPIHSSEAGGNRKKDETTFRSILQQIPDLLKQKSIDEALITRILKPGFDMLQDEKVWTGTKSGLAVFLAADVCKYIKMPVAPKEEIMINSSFYITPLLPMMTSNDHFYLLVLSKKQAAVFRADAFEMHRVQVADMPRGVDDVVHFEEKDDQKPGRPGGIAGGGTSFHGTGPGKLDDKESIAMYFDEVDETLCKGILNRENVPLLLSGVEYLIPIYKSVAKYKPIWEQSMTGNHERDDINSLYAEARRIMEPYFLERNEKALKAYWNQSATGLTSSTPEQIIPAAHYKQVWHLFVQKDQHIWGTFDEMSNKLVVHETQQEGDECLIDKCIIKTILNAGEVHVLSKEQMPDGSKIAALMRYQQ